ncbi:MAG: VOC family protein [Saprospiraceae bacterium]|nr:VOC family protein [Saprospiraceae bacterium]
MKPIISGVQQIGVGIPNVYEAWAWYRKNFGIDIPIFDEAAVAGLMLPYTGGSPQKRHAVLAINIQGGGGLEIWQYDGRVPKAPNFEIQLGDYGIFAAKIKSKNINASFEFLKKNGANVLNKQLLASPEGKPHFFVKDPYGNIFNIVSADDWFSSTRNFSTGGIYGAIVGVSDMDKSLQFYSRILGFDKVVYDRKEEFDDFQQLNGGGIEYRRVLLRHTQQRKGPFSKLLGNAEIELVQLEGRRARPIFEGRFWGDLGFIHLCFDIQGMNEMRELCEANNHPFTVDSSNSFDMGDAAGHFSYIEDPDGTLIEFVETHKVPIMKKLNWFLDLRNRNPERQLPTWMIKALAMNRVKD